MRADTRPVLALADAADREAIYRIRHEVYAAELGQHATNSQGRLTDDLDAGNVYLVGRRDGQVVGFVSITPPTSPRFSVDKYLARADLPFAFDRGLFEIRILTVVSSRRRGGLAVALLYAALRWVEAEGGTAVVVLGRRELLPFYEKTGLARVGRRVTSGRVVFEVMHATVAALRARADARAADVERIGRSFEWRLPVAFRAAPACIHGGAFFDAIGTTFETLSRRRRIVNADVLDAWFPPSPRAVAALRAELEWLLATSPPVGCEGLIATIAAARDVPAASILPGAGSSDLIYMALTRWLTRGDRALVLDPSYGEYRHLLGRVLGCRVESLELDAEDGFRVAPGRLARQLAPGHDLVVLVNPNSPTGVHLPRAELEAVLRAAPATTRFWIDETYVDYAGPDESLERFAAASANVVVCKSMSKAYALSGVRCAYLCGPPRLVEGLRAVTPPWAVGLVGQVAAVEALRDRAYYEGRWRETAALRDSLARGVASALSAEIIPGVANFVLALVPPGGPSPADLVRGCRARGVFLRDFPDIPRLEARALRIAVRDASGNDRILAALREVAR